MVPELINHKYGNLLLQLVVVYASKPGRQIIAKEAVKSLERLVKPDTGQSDESRWFAGNVLRACLSHFREEQFESLREAVLKILADAPSGRFRNWQGHSQKKNCQMQKARLENLCADKCNLHVARCIYEVVNQEEKTQMKEVERSLDLIPFQQKQQGGFKSSLFFQTWKSLGCRGAPKETKLCDITFENSFRWVETSIGTREPGEIRLHKLSIPRRFEGSRMIDLNLRRQYQIFVFAVETEDGLCTNLDPNAKIMMPTCLWVMFGFSTVHQTVEKFLDDAEVDTVESRWLAVGTFRREAVTEENIDLRDRYGINVLGCYRAGQDVILQPGADEMNDTSLVVFLSDLRKVQALLPASIDTESPKSEKEEEPLPPASDTDSSESEEDFGVFPYIPPA